ncbi:MAG: ATP-binding cassette domain-containing protein [Nocardioides sp.]|uniref:ABC transporter ATP-binding protein n=1 Tax=Nocardioides sp. TaxID=35761 RepID=UPI003263A27F
MPDSPHTIHVEELTKRYGGAVAVDHLSFAVRPGRVTGFLGPNGAGKSTTMRLILGLDRPDSGHATVGGCAYRDLSRPLTEVGALLDAGALHPARRARDHLRWLARSQHLSLRRVDEVLELVGLTEVAHARCHGFSLGMRQRLGLASAILGDPAVLLLDEPTNGLDPEGMIWIRILLRRLAAEGRTVLVSSHLMHEIALMADHLVVIGRGRLIADCTPSELVARSGGEAVLVRTPDTDRLTRLLSARSATVDNEDGALLVSGLSATDIAELAASGGVVLHELTPRAASLEAAFMELTHDWVEYEAGGDQ